MITRKSIQTDESPMKRKSFVELSERGKRNVMGMSYEHIASGVFGTFSGIHAEFQQKLTDRERQWGIQLKDNMGYRLTNDTFSITEGILIKDMLTYTKEIKEGRLEQTNSKLREATEKLTELIDWVNQLAEIKINIPVYFTEKPVGMRANKTLNQRIVQVPETEWVSELERGIYYRQGKERIIKIIEILLDEMENGEKKEITELQIKNMFGELTQVEKFKIYDAVEVLYKRRRKALLTFSEIFKDELFAFEKEMNEWMQKADFKNHLTAEMTQKKEMKIFTELGYVKQ